MAKKTDKATTEAVAKVGGGDRTMSGLLGLAWL